MKILKNLIKMGVWIACVMLGVMWLSGYMMAKTFVVTTSYDGYFTDSLSLREAIDSANMNPGPDVIVFDTDKLVFGGYRYWNNEPYWFIYLTTELPPLEDYTGGTAIVGDVNGNGTPDIVLSSPSLEYGFMITSSENVISGFVINNMHYGIILTENPVFPYPVRKNLITTCYLGTDIEGQNFGGGNIIGIYLNETMDMVDLNFIGEPNAGEDGVDNIICFSDSVGIFIQSADTTIVRGNHIGVGRLGFEGLPNDVHGILITAPSSSALWNFIGYAEPISPDVNVASPGASRNIISYNGQGFAKGSGVCLWAIPGMTNCIENNRIKANYIGTDKNGILRCPNKYAGIYIKGGQFYVDSNWVGFDNIIYNLPWDLQEGNLISGNGFIDEDTSGYGVVIDSACVNFIARNIIGLNATCDDSLPNRQDGVFITNFAKLNVIGNIDTFSEYDTLRNIIAGNKEGSGVKVSKNSYGNKIGRNYIGINLDEVVFPNDSFGIKIENSDSNIIKINKICGNKKDGIAIFGYCYKNLISRNKIWDNDELGIDLADDGVTPNDPNDTDDGPNGLLNYPEISYAYLDAYIHDTLKISGIANPNVKIEFYKVDEDPSGYGEGKEYIGETVSNSSGEFYFSISPAPVNLGDKITALAIDDDLNTSEFSENVEVQIESGICEKHKISKFKYVLKNGKLILLSAQNSRVKIEIYSVNGRKIKEISKRVENKMEIINFALRAGIYVMRLKVDNREYRDKFVVVK